MITTHPFQMIEKYDRYHLVFQTRKETSFWLEKHREIAERVDELTSERAVVYLSNIWLFIHPTVAQQPASILVRVVSDLSMRFLSRIELRAYVPAVCYTFDIEGSIGLKAKDLFNMLSMQRTMFDEQEPKFEQLREDLRKGLWII